MVDPNELAANPSPQVVSGEDLVELRLVMDAFGDTVRDGYDVQIVPATDPEMDGTEYYIVAHQP